MGSLRRRLATAPWGRLATLAVLFMLVAALVATGFVKEIDRRLAEGRFALLDRPASGSLVLVEIDAKSLAELNQWPWPRSIYAEAIEALDDAGAQLIALDVDFSSRSTAPADERLAAAIASASGRVVLPTFLQGASSGDAESLIESTPQRAFADHALLANVNVVPDADGVVRNGSYGHSTPEGRRSSLAGLLADAPYGRTGDFRIDFSIDAGSLPRVSFVDVVEGRVDPGIFRGRNVIVGATALELGDELVVPRFKIVPGPIVHALSYESLVQGRALSAAGPFAALLLAAIVLATILLASRRWSWPSLLGLNALILTALIAGSCLVELLAPVQVDIGGALLAQALGIFSAMASELHGRALEILQHRSAAARHRAVIDATLRDIDEGIIVTDDEGRIEMINPQAAYLLGRADDDLSGRLIKEVAPKFRAYDGAARRQFVAKIDGVEHAVEVTAARSAVAGRTGAQPVVIYSLHDVTARVRYERAEAAAKKAAEDALAAKTSLLSTMSHELRTPLNAVIGLSDMMSSQNYGPLGAPQYAEFAELIQRGGRQLLRIVNGVIETARLDSGEANIHRTPLSMRKLLRDSREAVAGKLRARQLSIDLRAPLDIDEVSADPDMFPWALNELINNAAEYSSPGEPIVIELRRDGCDALIVEVRNKAPAIDPEKLATLTEPFVQLDSSATREHDGAGLGLHIVDRYAALHGGSLTLSSTDAGEFSVRLRIPAALRPDASVAAAA